MGSCGMIGGSFNLCNLIDRLNLKAFIFRSEHAMSIVHSYLITLFEELPWFMKIVIVILLLG